MSGFLLDTNIVSDVMAPSPNPKVRAWLLARDRSTVHLSVLTIGELRRGVEMKRLDPPRRARLHEALGIIQMSFAGRILPLDEATAERWGELTAGARLVGRPLPVIDSLIAGTALHHDMILVTRNERDFLATGVVMMNPYRGTDEPEADFTTKR